MNDFEKELSLALRRPAPPEGFESRVLSRTQPKHAPRGRWWMAAGVAACLALSTGAFEYRQYRGRRAGRELLQALEITGAKLNLAQQKVAELNRRTIHE